jgi:hypothetical protein
LQNAINHLKKKYKFDEKLLKHISPLGWKHINFLGEYTFDIKNVPKSNKLRPLNTRNV